MTFQELMYKGLLGHYLEVAGIQSGVLFFSLMILGILICLIGPYLLGSLNFGIILSKKLCNDDIRRHGSGNAGMTNMLRTYGKKAAALTFLGDALKAFLAAALGRLILGELGVYLAGLMCIVGHVYPIYFRFHGGKGIVTTAIMILMINPIVFFILLVIFLIIVLMTKYISLGSIMCMLLYPVILNRIDGYGFSNIIAMMIAVFIIYLHRTNIKRLLNGTESKISLGRKKEEPTPIAAQVEDEDESEQGDNVGKPNPNTSKKKLKRRK